MKNTVIRENVPAQIESLLFPVREGAVISEIDGVTVENPNLKQIVGEAPDGSFFPVSVMGSDFASFDYRSVFEEMQAGMQAACPDAQLVTAAILSRGGRFCATYELPEDVSPQGRQDETRPQITLKTSLTGQWKTSISFGFWRMLCANEIASYTLKDLLLAFKRTKNSAGRITEIPQAIAASLASGQKYKEDMSRLVEAPLDPFDMTQLVIGFLANDKGEISTRSFNEAEEITRKARTSPGAEGKTAYDLLNGFTNHFSHERGEKSTKDAAAWFDSNRFGSGARHKVGFAQALLKDRGTLQAKGKRALELLAA